MNLGKALLVLKFPWPQSLRAVRKEYTNVSANVILAVVGSFIYLVKRKDLIPDSIPFIGVLDDVAVLGLALEMVKPELKAFRDSKAERAAAAAETAPAPETPEAWIR